MRQECEVCRSYGHDWITGRKDGVSLRICRTCGLRQSCFSEQEWLVWRDENA